MLAIRSFILVVWEVLGWSNFYTMKGGRWCYDTSKIMSKHKVWTHKFYCQCDCYQAENHDCQGKNQLNYCKIFPRFLELGFKCFRWNLLKVGELLLRAKDRKWEPALWNFFNIFILEFPKTHAVGKQTKLIIKKYNKHQANVTQIASISIILHENGIQKGKHKHKQAQLIDWRQNQISSPIMNTILQKLAVTGQHGLYTK